MANPIQAKKEKIAYLERRKERLVQQIGVDGFNRTVDSITTTLKRDNLDQLPTAREDLFEYINGIMNF